MKLVHKGIVLQEIHRSLTNNQIESRSFTSRTIADPGSMVMTSMGNCSEIKNREILQGWYLLWPVNGKVKKCSIPSFKVPFFESSSVPKVAKSWTK